MADVLGVEIGDLPEGVQVYEVIVLVKALDTDGVLTSFSQTSAGLAIWEKVGLLQMYADVARDQAVGSFEAVEGDE